MATAYQPITACSIGIWTHIHSISVMSLYCSFGFFTVKVKGQSVCKTTVITLCSVHVWHDCQASVKKGLLKVFGSRSVVDYGFDSLWELGHSQKYQMFFWECVNAMSLVLLVENMSTDEQWNAVGWSDIASVQHYISSIELSDLIKGPWQLLHWFLCVVR